MDDKREKEAEERFLKAVNNILDSVKIKKVPDVNYFQFFLPAQKNKLLNN